MAGPYGNNGLADYLETTKDNGVTNYVSTYKSFALKSAINACLDTDKDGISDVNDLDDDNDGIPDLNEMKCSTAVTYANDTSTSSAGNQNAQMDFVSNGITNIGTAADAALALKPFAGNFAFLLFAIGIIGVGLLAIPVLAGSASYAISEAFNWKNGLYRKLKQATSFYGVIIVAMVLGITLNFIGLDPIKALIYSAVLNGIISPIIIYFIVKISASEEIMGQYKTKKVGNIIGWFTTILLIFVSVGTIISIFM